MKRVWSPGLGRYLLLRPVDLVIVLRAGWRMRRDRWWRRSPFLPLPDPAYWHFRVVTANGSSETAPSPASMVDAAKWALAQPVGRS